MTLTIARAQSPDALWGAAVFVNKHHSYIRWADRPSRKLYWSIFEDGERIGVFGLGSAYDWPKDVAAYMKAHDLSFNNVANNIVYALHGSSDRNAGTRALALIRRDAVRWWKDSYGDDLRAFQTFIAPPRTGALYLADNWTRIGMTSGDGVETVTLAPDAVAPEGSVERVTHFAGGVVRRTAQVRKAVTPKIILMREVSKREARQAAALPERQPSMF